MPQMKQFLLQRSVGPNKPPSDPSGPVVTDSSLSGCLINTDPAHILCFGAFNFCFPQQNAPLPSPPRQCTILTFVYSGIEKVFNLKKGIYKERTF